MRKLFLVIILCASFGLLKAQQNMENFVWVSQYKYSNNSGESLYLEFNQKGNVLWFYSNTNVSKRQLRGTTTKPPQGWIWFRFFNSDTVYEFQIDGSEYVKRWVMSVPSRLIRNNPDSSKSIFYRTYSERD